MFNIAIFQNDRRYLLQEIKVPVAYLIGGSKDMGYTTVSFPLPMSIIWLIVVNVVVSEGLRPT